ncbi:hypothetical protein [Paenibacillus aquistagni]|uniref:hypothetical protein n=1 Tax=Paenibacillus aquistagni TaxID=1852522 RepID=UPI000B4FF97B|nr:hypothetical protein [Paenibacillus aquistagni]
MKQVVKLERFYLAGRYYETKTEMESWCKRAPYQHPLMLLQDQERCSYGVRCKEGYFAGVKTSLHAKLPDHLYIREVLAGTYELLPVHEKVLNHEETGEENSVYSNTLQLENSLVEYVEMKKEYVPMFHYIPYDFKPWQDFRCDRRMRRSSGALRLREHAGCYIETYIEAGEHNWPGWQMRGLILSI